MFYVAGNHALPRSIFWEFVLTLGQKTYLDGQNIQPKSQAILARGQIALLRRLIKEEAEGGDATKEMRKEEGQGANSKRKSKRSGAEG